MTYLQLVNRVLRRLREDEVTDFNETYTALIAEFVSEIHAEVLSHDWSLFDHEVRVSLVGAQGEYDLSATVADSGDVANGYTPTTLSSMLRFVDNKPLVFWFDTGSTQAQPLYVTSWQEYQRLQSIDTSQTGTMPNCVAFRQDGEGWRMAVWPTPIATAGEIRSHWNTPEAQLDPDVDPVSREIEVPWRPVYLGALYLALNERGEEIGEPGNVAEQRYYSALSAAKEVDIAASGRVNRYEFFRE